MTVLSLRRDPSVRFTDTGRSLLQWLGVHTRHRPVPAVRPVDPDYWRAGVAELA
jgi:hypothetical protein